MKTIKPEPHQLPCHTTSDELRPIVNAALVKALTDLMNQPDDPDKPVDPRILENQKVWESGNKDLWLELELKRILGSKDSF